MSAVNCRMSRFIPQFGTRYASTLRVWPKMRGLNAKRDSESRNSLRPRFFGLCRFEGLDRLHTVLGVLAVLSWGVDSTTFGVSITPFEVGLNLMREYRVTVLAVGGATLGHVNKLHSAPLPLVP